MLKGGLCVAYLSLFVRLQLYLTQALTWRGPPLVFHSWWCVVWTVVLGHFVTRVGIVGCNWLMDPVVPDLVAGIKKRYPDIEVSVSAYPEKHPESASLDADIDVLKAKVDAGAARAITQFFFDNDLYNRYVDRVRARGIDIPIVPGILPVQNFKLAKNFATRAGATVPAWLAEKFDGLDDDADTRKLVAAAVAAGQVQKLAKHGVDNFHFYTMNRADLVFAISHLLGFRANGAQKAA